MRRFGCSFRSFERARSLWQYARSLSAAWAASVIVARGRFYGGRFVCAPEAGLETAQLHVCLFTRGGRRAVLRYAIALMLGYLPRLADYRIVAGRQVTIEGPDGDPVQGDGDIIARLPVTIDLDPTTLSLVVPG